MRVALLGFTLGDERIGEIMKLDRAMPSQTHRFAWSLVGLLDAAGARPYLLSAPPVSNYPGFPKIVFRGGSFVAKGCRGSELPFVNLVAVKHLSRFISAVTVGRRAIRSEGIDTLVVHGVHSPWLWFSALMHVRGLKTVVVATDPPGVILADDSALVRGLKMIDRTVVTAALRHQSGVVVLAPALAELWAPSLPSLLMEGVAPGPWRGSEPGAGPADGAFRIVYAGALNAEYGAKALVEALDLIASPNIELHMLGKGPLEDWIRMRAERDPRVRPPQLVHPEQVGAALDRAHVLVQPRPLSMREARFSFPSKLLEYLAAGRPVISTPLPTLPREYASVLKLSQGDGPQALADAISDVMAMDVPSRDAMGRRARDFAEREKSELAQGQRFIEFLQRI